MMMLKCLTNGLILFGLSIPQILSAYSEFDEDIGSARYITDPTGEVKKISTLPVIASVVSRSEIEDFGFSSISEVLKSIPGLYVPEQPFQNGDIHVVRGFTSTGGIRFLVNGVPAVENLFGNADLALGRIPIEAVDRIEVTRGPGSNLFGGESFVAVANIVTRQPVTNRDFAQVRYGSSSTTRVGVGSDRSFGDGSGISIVADYFETDDLDYSVDADIQTNLDVLFGSNASNAPGSISVPRKEASILATYVSDANNKYSIRSSHWRDKAIGLGWTGAVDQQGAVDLDSVEVGSQIQLHSNEGGRTQLVANYGYLTHSYDSVQLFPPGSFGNAFPDGVLFSADHSQQSIYGRISHEFFTLDIHELEIGLGVEYNKAKQGTARRNFMIDPGTGNLIPTGLAEFEILPEGDISRTNRFVYIEDQISLSDDYLLTIGTRLDDYSDHGAIRSTRAALVWNADYDLTYKLIYGRGFRVPTYRETDINGVPGLLPNSQLDPEKLDSVDFAVDYALSKNVSLRANIFRHVTEDQINQTDAGLQGVLPQNVGRQIGEGVEIEGEWIVSNFTSFKGSISRQENEIESVGQDAGFTPRNIFRFAAVQKYRSFLFGLNTYYVSQRKRAPGDTKGRNDDFGNIDLNVIYEESADLKFSLKVTNLLDDGRKEPALIASFPSDVNLSGRAFYFSVRADF